MRDRLRRAYCLSGLDHVRKTGGRKQRTDIGKCSFVNRTIENWNQLPAETVVTLSCKPKIFRNRVRKVIINGSEMEGIEVWQKSSKDVVK